MKPLVIMPVWANEPETISITEEAVKSLAGFPLLIIDNGSSVGGGQLREWADIYIHNKENLGYAKAVNQGLKLADKGEIVCVANNDIRVSPNWWGVAKEIFEDKKVGSVHFRMIPYNEPFSFGDDTWKEGKERWGSSSLFVMRNVQLYDENFFNSVEDWDFWIRMRLEKKLRTAYTNKACYQHYDSYTRYKRPALETEDQMNRDYFVAKWGTQPE